MVAAVWRAAKSAGYCARRAAGESGIADGSAGGTGGVDTEGMATTLVSTPVSDAPSLAEPLWDRPLPAAQVRHFEAQSSAQVPAATHIRFNTSKVRYFRKYHGALAGEFLRRYLLAQFAFQLALEGVKGALGHQRALRQARVAAYWAVLRSGLRG